MTDEFKWGPTMLKLTDRQRQILRTVEWIPDFVYHVTDHGRAAARLSDAEALEDRTEHG